MTSDYVPIDCDQHSVLELLAMRRAAVTARAGDAAGGICLLEGVVADVTTRSGAEYLILQDATGKGLVVRLDRLLELRDGAGHRLWRQKIDPGELGKITS
jgi:transcriptional antiterminator Rof (Rho-off)